MVKREPMLERRDEAMPEPGGYFELGGCLSSFVYDHDQDFTVKGKIAHLDSNDGVW